MTHAGLLSLDCDDSEAPQEQIDSAWRAKIDHRLEGVLHGWVELGSFEATRETFATKYPTAVR